MAEKRFRCLERRLASKPELYQNVKTQIIEYQAKGYIHKVSKKELASFDPKRTWFLPLNVVTNPRKPNKVRLVWDAAAKVQGQSLDSALLAGPDFLIPLTAVLSSFRQFEVAVSADICEMFNQFLIRPEDRSAQLFLWRDDPSKPFDVFVMDVATFGSTCSPSAAQFIKKRNAVEFSEQFPRAAEAITNHHYVDDFLCSVHTEQEAVELAEQVHSKAGFNIRNWLSNSCEVLIRVGEQQAESQKKLLVDRSAAYERVLGMIWKPEPDRTVPSFKGLTEIHDLTQVDEWRWVPTRLNVADEDSKWGKGPNIASYSRWFHAPSFLYQHPDLWPLQTTKEVETVEELRPVHLHQNVVENQLLKFERFSKWERLVRAVAYARRFVDILRCRIKKLAPGKTEFLNRDEILKAESTIFILIQLETFGDELVILKRNRGLPAGEQMKIEKTSKISKLSPFLDEQDVMRMDGRIANAQQVSFDFKFPVILPKRHGGTKLLVDWYHRQYKHCNGFHVSEMRVAFKLARKQCQWCNIYKTTPEIPRMAPLPQARTVSHVRPFTYVGVDYFGPMLVKQGRSEVKRWVALFTCLTIRSVHLEVVHNLTTESCKMAIRRFIARRGAPREIFSDRGTNFVGASRDLKRELQHINSNLAGTFTNTDTQWRFNPPSTPHMGGVMGTHGSVG
ncbi:uncharacterized protein LOC135715126 [Ochlerotatus camptorhynchus]|uniref:uncharacterized protein LOC135715126 n=1 Tax=Ochlerotatus camptorhynchus TaxID=644619 RepID=UPI0031D3D278